MNLRELLTGILPKLRKRVRFELVQRVRRPILERIIGNEPVGDVLLLLADHFAELKRQRRRYRYRALNVLVIVHDLGRSGICKNPADDIGRVITAHAADDGIQICGLPA